jgi:hypothetical protein
VVRSQSTLQRLLRGEIKKKTSDSFNILKQYATPYMLPPRVTTSYRQNDANIFVVLTFQTYQNSQFSTYIYLYNYSEIVLIPA